jgi:Protein tyrosine kinase.
MAMDVYAYAITCVEVLTMGRMPWPLMDDEAVRHFVLSSVFFVLFCFFSLPFFVLFIVHCHGRWLTRGVFCVCREHASTNPTRTV